MVANDATVKAGSWWPETIRKILRAQEVAMRQRIPIVYLVDSAGVNLPYQGGVFPGQYGAARIFYYNSIMRRYLHVPQISAVMGSCIAGGAYLPALSDVIFMVEGTSFMGLGGPNLVKGATGQTIDAETLGGARHPHRAERRGPLPRGERRGVPRSGSASTSAGCRGSRACSHQVRARAPAGPPGRPTSTTSCPQDHRLSYDMRHVLACLLDGGALDEFQPDVAREMICGHAHIEGWPVAVIANQRGVIKGRPGERPRFGGIVYTGSAEKVAYFIETASRERLPILFVQDVSGFMVGPEAEHAGSSAPGAHFVEAMATAVVPKIVLTVNHASGAGYYAMAGQGFDPDFILSWPTGRMGVMEGESAVMAVHGPEIERAQREKRELAPEVQALDGVDARRLRGAARRPLRRGARARGRHRHARGDPRPARLRAPRLRQLRRAPPRPVRAAAARRGLRPARSRMRRHPARWPRRSLLACARLAARTAAAPTPARPRDRSRARRPRPPRPRRRRRQDDSVRAARAARGGATPTAGCRSRAPASDRFAAGASRPTTAAAS